MSSRRSVFKGFFALAALAVAADCRLRSSKERGPRLRLEPATDREPGGAAAWRGLALALRALPEVRRAELVEAISDWVAEAEERHHPFAIDLSDETSPPLERVRTWFLPIWNAATALDARRWQLPGQPLQVVVTREGGCSSGGARVFRAWDVSEEKDASIAKARFAAWPVTHARLIDAATPAGRSHFAAALGTRLCDPASCLGLFVDRALLDRPDRCREFDSIRALAERARRLVARSTPPDFDPELAGLLNHLPPGEPLSTLKEWLELGECELLVVPRLGALARTAAFDEELRGLRDVAGVPK